MPTDPAPVSAQDTRKAFARAGRTKTPPAILNAARGRGAQHVWKKAARADPRHTAAHLAYLDARAEHWREDDPLGNWLTDERAAWWTGLSVATIKRVRRDEVAWGWMTKTRNGRNGECDRYALTTPAANLVMVYRTRCEVDGCQEPVAGFGARKCHADTLTPPESVTVTPESLPVLPSYLSVAQDQDQAPAVVETKQADKKLRPKKTTQAARPAAPAVDQGRAQKREAVAAVLPAAVVDDARTWTGGNLGRLSGLLAAAYAAGHTPQAVRDALANVGGLRTPVGAVVGTLRDLAATPAKATPAQETPEQAEERRRRIAAEQAERWAAFTTAGDLAGPGRAEALAKRDAQRSAREAARLRAAQERRPTLGELIGGGQKRTA